jgi:hypothetical protein
MTPRMLRLAAYACMAAMLGIAAVWILQEAGLLGLLEEPLVGVIGFGLLGMTLYGLSKRSPDRLD